METPSVEQIMRIIEKREKEAYQKGWNDAVANIVAAASQGMPAGTLHPAQAARRPRTRLIENHSEHRAGTKAIDVILQIISERPGLRGIEVFKEAVARMPGSDLKTMDRTGRTALKRLRERGKITQRAKRWLPVKEAENE
jgi:hypothetical protein